MIHNSAVFMLISCFYAGYFAKQLQLRRKGISTNRLAKGDKPRRTRAIERGLLALTYAAAVIQYAGVFLSDYMLPLSLPDAARWAGLAVTACGVLFFIMAVAAMRDNWRAGVDESQKTAIVTQASTGSAEIRRLWGSICCISARRSPHPTPLCARRR